ncbi:MAG: MFS transporter [Dehalococcoidia bacterium]|nr:MFS transporter [Dehalococcoidia bacterium]
MELLPRIRDELAFEGNIRKSYIYRFLMNFQLWWPIWVIYLLQERGLSYTQITLLDTPFFVLIVLAEVPTGAIADHFGRKTSLMLASTLFAVAIFVFGIAQNYLLILVSYTAWGLAQTFQSGADTAILYDSLKQIGREDDFQQINGRLWALTSTAVLIAMLIGAPIAAATSLSFPIVLSAGVALVAVPVAASMHEPRRERGDEAGEYARTVIAGIRDVFRTPPLRYIILFSAILFMSTFAPLIFLQPFLAHHGAGIGSLGLWQAPVRGAGIVSALLAARFIARAGQRAAFLAMPLALGLCYIALAGIDQAWVYVAFLPVGMVAGMQNPVLATYVNRRIPSERRATILSVQSVLGSMLLAAMEPTGGFVADQLGLRALFLLFGVLVLATAPAALWLWSRVESGDLAVTAAASERTAEAVPAS